MVEDREKCLSAEDLPAIRYSCPNRVGVAGGRPPPGSLLKKSSGTDYSPVQPLKNYRESTCIFPEIFLTFATHPKQGCTGQLAQLV
jgi:hypothetical protein